MLNILPYDSLTEIFSYLLDDPADMRSITILNSKSRNDVLTYLMSLVNRMKKSNLNLLMIDTEGRGNAFRLYYKLLLTCDDSINVEYESEGSRDIKSIQFIRSPIYIGAETFIPIEECIVRSICSFDIRLYRYFMTKGVSITNRLIYRCLLMLPSMTELEAMYVNLYRTMEYKLWGNSIDMTLDTNIDIEVKFLHILLNYSQYYHVSLMIVHSRYGEQCRIVEYKGIEVTLRKEEVFWLKRNNIDIIDLLYQHRRGKRMVSCEYDIIVSRIKSVDNSLMSIPDKHFIMCSILIFYLSHKSLSSLISRNDISDILRPEYFNYVVSRASNRWISYDNDNSYNLAFSQYWPIKHSN